MAPPILRPAGNRFADWHVSRPARYSKNKMSASHFFSRWPSVLRLFLPAMFLVGFTPDAIPAPAPVPSDRGQHVFAAGEDLTYAVFYLGFQGGTVTMHIRNGGVHDGRPVYKLVNRAQSQQPVTAFFPVDDRIESFIDAESFVPLQLVFHKQEGKKRTDSTVSFHHEEGTATTIKDGVTDTRSIPPGTQHAFSALYYLRSLPSVTVGSEVTLNVHHEKKNYPLHAKVEGIDEITGGWGTKKALRVGVTLPYTGIWLNSGKMDIWVTNDPSHVPLKMKANMVIGSITAELIDGPGITHEFDDSSARNSF